MHTIAIFGEAETGLLNSLIFLRSLPELTDKLGSPTPSGIGIHMAIQAILYEKEILYYRVTEEGINNAEYHLGLKLLDEQYPPPTAIAFPRVANEHLLHQARIHCHRNKSHLLTTERDFHDFMAIRPPSQ